ncbi:hypothetical protein CCACVL1_03822 [Corchorus capsularis]|uniref:Uncharacterized protein n=1 Tax=Corchorus capsularis TaxID=210143 RepID=A0A1R3JX19_COCAP|nr:hypothetical protein CCACVL1_03822 [Corchorus capsularis]
MVRGATRPWSLLVPPPSALSMMNEAKINVEKTGSECESDSLTVTITVDSINRAAQPSTPLIINKKPKFGEQEHN